MKEEMRTILFIPAVTMGFLLLVSGCQTTPRYNFESDPEVDFTSYKTFAMMPLPSQIPGAEPGLILRIGDVLKSTLENQLKGKGYTQVDIDSADFTVNVTGKVVPKVDVTNFGYIPYHTYPSAGRWGHYHPYASGYGNVYVDKYEEGTLIVEIYDAKTKKLAWVGWTTGKRNPKGPDLELLAERLSGVVDAFPTVQ